MSNKVNQIRKQTGVNNFMEIRFNYDGFGNRVCKLVDEYSVVSSSSGTVLSLVKSGGEYYVRDGQGNVISIYNFSVSGSGVSFKQREVMMYGSNRLGVEYRDIEMIGNTGLVTDSVKYYFGKKHYELTNHLGNVMSTISDRKIGVDSDGDNKVDYYVADVRSLRDYYPFGQEMEGRGFDPVKPYRFGFNTQERVFEIERDHYTAKYWEYDGRLGRRWNRDPEPTSGWSEYSVLFGNPIKNVDVLGNKPLDDYKVDKKGNITLVKKTNDKKDRLFATDEQGKMLDDKFIEVDKGVLDKRERIESKNIDILKVRGDNKAKDLFEFLAQNTEVEWGWTMLGIEGEKGLNYLTTSHDKSRERGAEYLFSKKFLFGYTIRGFVHNHPSNTPYPSGLGNDNGDVDFVRWVETHTKTYKPVFMIYTARDAQYIQYNQYSKPEDFPSYSNPIIELPEIDVIVPRKEEN